MYFKVIPGIMLFFAIHSAGFSGEGEVAFRARAEKDFGNGNYLEAFQKYETLCLNPETNIENVPNDFRLAVQCLQNLNRVDEIDDFREKVVTTHPQTPNILHAVAESYFRSNHYGYIVSGTFYRGYHRGGGKYVNSIERDRVRALQIMMTAFEAAQSANDRTGFANICFSIADMFIEGRTGNRSWRLRYLTDLSVLPDYAEDRYMRDAPRGAPVDEEGKPVFYRIPESFSTAASDGERWRFFLDQAVKAAPTLKSTAQRKLADFLFDQFGVHSLASSGWKNVAAPGTGDLEKGAGIFALHTLAEDETIAMLASGMKRFHLPEEFNYIRIYKELSDYRKLARIFENRRQFPKAAEYWEKAGDREKVRMITGAWGTFEPVMTQPAGKGATVDFKYRNGKTVRFEANRIHVKKLLSDIREYIRDNPRRPDHRKESIEQIGYRIVQENENRYKGEKVAQWSVDLDPDPDHFDKRITVATPLMEAGAYLLKGEIEDGNTSRIIIWLDDTVIVKKALDQGMLIFVADAMTGAPVSGADVEFFGYRRRWRNKLFGYRTDIDRFGEITDKRGVVIFTNPSTKPEWADNETAVADDHPDRRKNWLIVATTPDGRFACHGFSRIWYSGWHDAAYRAVKSYFITDRPVYRPGGPVHFKCWIRKAQYDSGDTSAYAGKPVSIQITNPKNEKVFEETFTADEWGGLSGTFNLPDDAALGMYRIFIPGHPYGYHTGDFRVEEYKKPEFEVTVQAPAKPVRLGDTIQAKIEAKYYFGAPVEKAKVKYKVLRYDYYAQKLPAGPWDWFYGNGYSWFGYDYKWYPGWFRWGCEAPFPWWMRRRSSPPELVMENEVEIGKDGTVTVDIDTRPAAELLEDRDHRYEIVAEVTDMSRRVIVGKGSVIAARSPFSVTVWVEKGYYHTGDKVKVGINARTPDGRPVQGKGKLTLFRVTYDKNRNPMEKKVEEWPIESNEEGKAEIQIHASAPGQYRLSQILRDKDGNEMEGGYVFIVRGKDFTGDGFRFNALEVIPDKKEFSPGEKVNVMINTDRADSMVLLFLRPSNGVCLPPKFIQIKGKSTIYEFPVIEKDMPNFFIEALTVSNGKVHTENREIIVPPEKKILNVQVLPDSDAYTPGGKAKIDVRLTDLDGQPFVGSTVLSVYDKAVEYIYGGSNVPGIRPFFWKWRRSHSPRTESSLDRRFYNLLRKKEIPMRNIGVFGFLGVDEVTEADGFAKGQRELKKMRRSMPAPAPAASLAMKTEVSAGAAAPMEDAMGEKEALDQEEAVGGEPTVQPTIRKEFADTAFWKADIVTDAQGMATVEFDMPENLTGWKIKAWSMGQGTRVGEGEAFAVTRKNLMVRLQAPRFFTQKDEVILSANVHNYLEKDVDARVVIELDGDALKLLDEKAQPVRIPSGDEIRVDWRVLAEREGEAVVRMMALTSLESDAMEMKFPVYVHGMDKMVSFCGVIRPEKKTSEIVIEIPEERRKETSRLEIRYSPTLAGALVDALPYLADYPYGCTEQTLNRFLPSVITRNVLKKLGVNLSDIREKRTNLNAQEIGDDKTRSEGWKRFDRNPVFDDRELRKMVKTGVNRLTSMQLSDGGWGWFSGWGERSWPHTTAVVVHGLQVARHNDVAVLPDVLERGIAWLKSYQEKQVKLIENGRKQPKKNPWKTHPENMDAFIYMVLVDAGMNNQKMGDFLYQDRNQLSVYGKSMLGIAFHQSGQMERRDMLRRNIEQYLVTDEENQTAWLNLGNEGYWWFWYGNEIEAHAYYLKLLSKIDPKGETAAMLVKYLLNNRKHATYWGSTRDTAICIESMADFLIASGEDRPDMTVEISLDGKKMKESLINSKNLFSFDNRLLLTGDAIESGSHTIVIDRKGKGPLYFNAYLSYFTLEDNIGREGLEIRVDRKYFKLEPKAHTEKTAGSKGQALDRRVEKYRRVELENLDLLKSGDLVEIEFTIESKNDYEYIVLEDMKAAGFEPVDVRSGWVSDGPGAYMELRDEKTVFFIRALMRGKHSIAYRLRSEIPGRFSALPTRAYGMYAPELKSNSDEIKLRIKD